MTTQAAAWQVMSTGPGGPGKYFHHFQTRLKATSQMLLLSSSEKCFSVNTSFWLRSGCRKEEHSLKYIYNHFINVQWADLWALVWAGQRTTASAPPPPPSGAACLSSLRQVRLSVKCNSKQQENYCFLERFRKSQSHSHQPLHFYLPDSFFHKSLWILHIIHWKP